MKQTINMAEKSKLSKKESAGAAAGITELKQTQEALARSEDRYRNILDNMQDPYIEVDLAGNFTFVNEATCQNLGYTAGELIGLNFSIISPDKDELRAVLNTYNEVYKTGKPHKGYAFKVVRKDSSTGYGEISISLLKDTRGNPCGFYGVGRDVTERKQAEKALRESEEKYRTLVEKMDEAIIIAQNGIFVFANRRMGDLLGMPEDDLLGKPFIDFVWPEDREMVFTNYSRRVAGENVPDAYDFRIIGAGGKLTWVFISATAVQWGGKPATINLITDITDRKKAEAALQESEAKYRRIVELANEGIISLDSDTRISFVNKQMASKLGYTIEEMLGQKFEYFLADDQLNDHLAQMKIRVQGEDAVYERCFRRKDGHKHWALVSAKAVLDSEGKFEGAFGMLTDITERKQIETALRESEEKYRILVENALETIFIASDGMLKFTNRRAATLTGYSPEELASRPFSEFVHTDDRDMLIARHFRRLAGEDAPSLYTFRLVCKTGDTKWVEVSTSLITWEGKPATLNFLHDVTDHKRLEEEQQRVEKLESVGVLAGGIAHDFNNILTAILGNISLARIEAAPGSDLQNSLEQAEKASLRAKALTVQLLTFSKGGAPVRKLAPLSELLKDTASFALRGSNVKCRFDIPADLWPAEIDVGQVSQAIHNLAINAQQAMPNGGIIEINARNLALSETQSIGKGLPLKSGDYIRISVTDHGSGIPKENLDKIFEPFFTTRQNGSGLGLATTFSIARQHGGHLSVESEPGSGSTFFLYLPASTQVSLPAPDKGNAIKAAGKARILVMDDEKGVREIANRMLRHIGYEDIVLAADGAEAVNQYRAGIESGNPFGAVILDLTVAGGMGGEVAIRKLLEINPGLKAIVSSGYLDDPVIASYREYGFSGMIAKPYTLEELSEALHDAIG